MFELKNMINFSLIDKRFLIIISWVCSVTCFTQTFTQKTVIYTPDVYYPKGINSIDLGDYDNDGDLDVLMTIAPRYNDKTLYGKTLVYKNNGDNTYTNQTLMSFKGMYNGTARWGDLNNDGYLDIVESGVGTGGSWADIMYFTSSRTYIYINNGDGTFSEQLNTGLPNLGESSIALGDYDNDGFLDILLAGDIKEIINGVQKITTITKVYRNNGDKTFTEQKGITLTGVSYGSVAWGDYNNDGNLDIILTGSKEFAGDWSSNPQLTLTSSCVSKIYRNNGDNTFTEQTGITLTGVTSSSVAWGDYDNDGYADLLLTGTDVNNLAVSKIYRNNGNETFTEQTGISLAGVSSKNSLWVDYDKDGFLDVFLSGIVYRNNGNNTFTEQTNISFPTGKPIACGDMDNNKTIDIMVDGTIYTNDVKVVNTIPTNAPTDLTHSLTLNSTKLMWKSDPKTLSGLGASYNLKVFDKTKSISALPSNSADDGFRKVTTIGNAQLNTSYTLKDLKSGTYYWQVQSVSNNFQGSAFSVTDSFVVITPLQSSGLTMLNIVGSSARLKWKRGNLNKCVVFIKEGSGNCLPSSNNTYLPSDVYKKGSSTSDGWYCVYVGTADSINVSGLSGLSTYTAAVFEFEGNTGSEQYLATLSSENSVEFKTTIDSVELSKEVQTEFYPNPVEDILTIDKKDITETSQLNIYSIEGSILYNSTLIGKKITIDMKNYKKGIYILEISSSEKSIRRKLIKM